MISIPVPFFVQGKRSANCGPCAVKSIIEYFNITKSDSSKYSIHSINRLLKTTKEYGCDEDEIAKFLIATGLFYQKITPEEIELHIDKRRPILVLFRDELHDGHFAVISGYDNDNFLFQDPWPEFGENFKRKRELFFEQAAVFDNWLLAIDRLPF